MSITSFKKFPFFRKFIKKAHVIKQRAQRTPVNRGWHGGDLGIGAVSAAAERIRGLRPFPVHHPMALGADEVEAGTF